MTQDTTKKPDPLDVEIGVRIRTRRKLLGISQTQLAQALGLTFQQVQKYERGTNRVSFSTLVRICNTLKTSIATLTNGLDEVSGGTIAHLESPAHRAFSEIVLSAGGSELIQAIAGLTPVDRRCLLTLLERNPSTDGDVRAAA